VSADPDALRIEMIENAGLPFGAARNAQAEALVERADASGEPGLVAHALLELVEAYVFSGESGKAFVPFTRALRLYDSTVDAFDPWDTHALFWSFKWMTSHMAAYPEVSLDQIEGALADMRARYGAVGYGADAVHMCEFDVAWSIGDETRAAAAFDRWVAGERDEMSDCAACVPSFRAAWLTAHERDAEAVELLRTVTAGHLRCAEQPEQALARSLLPLARLGRLVEARTNHIRGYRLVKGNPAMQKEIGQHLAFCARTGNIERGLRLWSANTRLLDAADTPMAHLELLCGLVTLLELALTEVGADRAVVGRGGVGTTVGDLLGVVTAEAFALAGRFDARNGTDRYRHMVEDAAAAKPVVDHLPFVGPALPGPALDPGTPVDPVVPVVADAPDAPLDHGGTGDRVDPAEAAARRAAAAHAAAADGRPAAAAEHALAAARAFEALADADRSVDCYLDLARYYLDLGRASEAAELAEQLVPVASEVGPGAAVQAFRVLGAALAALGDHAGAAAQHSLAARVAERTEDMEVAADAADDAGIALHHAGRPSEAAGAFTRSANHYEYLGQLTPHVRLRRSAAIAFQEAGLSDEARGELGRARAALRAAMPTGAGSAGDAPADPPVADAAGARASVPAEVPSELAYEMGEVDRLAARMADARDDIETAVALACRAAAWHARSASWPDESATARFAAELLVDRLDRVAEAEPWARRACVVVPDDVAPGEAEWVRARCLDASYATLARVLDGMGRGDDAGAARARCDAAYDALYGEDDHG
jgi:tetratricopeptide (TPR) repeat protein